MAKASATLEITILYRYHKLPWMLIIQDKASRACTRTTASTSTSFKFISFALKSPSPSTISHLGNKRRG